MDVEKKPLLIQMMSMKDPATTTTTTTIPQGPVRVQSCVQDPQVSVASFIRIQAYDLGVEKKKYEKYQAPILT